MNLHIDEDRIEEETEVKAPRAQVWRALTDYREFGTWLHVKLDGPFVTGEATSGRLTYPGYEHLMMEVVVQAMEPKKYFSFTWHPYAIEPNIDYAQETPTLVEFHLKDTGAGTLVRVIESGFSELPANRRAEAFRKNAEGWSEQLKNIGGYVEKNS